MEEALKGKPVKGFNPPKEGVVGVYVNPENGKLASKDCPVRRFTYFVAGTEPTEYCTDHLKHENHKPAKEKQETKDPWYKKIFKWGALSQKHEKRLRSLGLRSLFRVLALQCLHTAYILQLFF